MFRDVCHGLDPSVTVPFCAGVEVINLGEPFVAKLLLVSEKFSLLAYGLMASSIPGLFRNNERRAGSPILSWEGGVLRPLTGVV